MALILFSGSQEVKAEITYGRRQIFTSDLHSLDPSLPRIQCRQEKMVPEPGTACSNLLCIHLRPHGQLSAIECHWKSSVSLLVLLALMHTSVQLSTASTCVSFLKTCPHFTHTHKQVGNGWEVTSPGNSSKKLLATWI